ncbi:MAG TPA: cyclopropane-fatty-acyl-phospholipid synthase family protein [Gemmatimonadaceae bacterium]|nr:cyclopropane-fatty-acyl-phospholipid synthase family protein [Gemmatimonadaceae bacterium]
MARVQGGRTGGETSVSVADPAVTTTRAILTDLFGAPQERGFAVRLWNGLVESPTDASAGTAPFTLILTRSGSLRRALMPPSELSLVEAFIDGDIEIQGDLESAAGLGDRLAARIDSIGAAARVMWRAMALPRDRDERTGGAQGIRDPKIHGLLRLGRRHSEARDARAVRFHYDVSNDFYALWLDHRMVYSCAYFDDGVRDLDQAQEAKLDYVCRKLRLKPGERLLDIGCGWGGLIIHAAERYGVTAVGITLSERQAAWARARIAEAGLAARVRVEVADYRRYSDAAPFDKIASVGMVEHVGIERLPDFFTGAFRLLAPGGLFLNHGIVSIEEARPRPLRARIEGRLWRRGAFMGKYVFPDGNLVASSSVVACAEAAGFELRDVESLRDHYARTLRLWLARLEARQSEAIPIVGEQIYRVWRLFLASSAYGFRVGRIGVIQSVLAKPDAAGWVPLPMTRRDLYEDTPRAVRDRLAG